ncbi:MAG: cytochrome c biogenesis protein CcsA [Planctomycetaceae bacterium]
MATTVLPAHDSSDPVGEAGTATRRRQRPGLGKRILSPLASLKLTVVLMAIGIFIVLAGTLAQAEMGIERVVNEFFRVRPWGPTFGFAWIPFQIFLPESFFPGRPPQVGGGFWFPGGWLIGSLMFVNLIAAHAVRFTVQAKGMRLLAGQTTLLLGIAVTAIVVASGSGAAGLQATPILNWTVLWRLFQTHVVLFAAANIGIAAWLYLRPGGDRRYAWIAIAATPITLALAAWALLISDVSDSSMRILWQLIKGTMAALVLLAGCVLVFRKRSGIVLLHSGVGLLMISELLVGLQAVETMMVLREEETRSWAQDIRTVELSVVDPSPADHDTLTRFPVSRLKPDAILAHESIPFRIRIDQYFDNATVVDLPAGETNPADSGFAHQAQWVVRETPEVAGTSTDGGVNTPAAYVTVLDAEGRKKLGTYLLSAELSRPETVRIGDVEWRIDLRFERDYKPYSVTLIDIRKDNYVGTDVVKNYSSDIRVASDELGANFQRRIWMNNPLRFAGETLYQTNYLMPDKSGREGSAFQVVKNTGWMLPYVACMIVVVGMAAQFFVTLSRFVGRRAAATTATAAGRQIAGRRDRYGWVVPAVVTLFFFAWLGSKFAPPRAEPGEPDLVAFAELPIASQGRLKPIDTVARDALKALSNNRQQFKTGETYGPFDLFHEKEPAIRWLMEFIADPREGGQRQVVRIDNDELLSVLELPTDREGFMYSITEVSKAVPALAKRMDEVRAKIAKGETLDAADRATQELERKVGVIDLLLTSFQPNTDVIQGGVPALREYMRRYQVLKHGDMSTEPDTPSRNPPLAVFYKDLASEDRDWETLGHAQLMEGILQWAASRTGEQHESDSGVVAWNNIIDAWNKNDTAGFNAAVKKYRASLEAETPKGYSPGKVDFEAYFNHAAPFYYLMIPYVFAALLAAFSWMGLSRPLNRTAFWLVVMTFVLHTLALAGRIYISGRPPVTNLYSSAVFIGWGAVAFGIGLECLYRLGFGNVLAGVIGSATLLVAHNLSGDGSDTFSVLQAVLDTQFWLATHVVTVTLGYTATYAAGLLGLLYVILGLTTRLLRRPMDDADHGASGRSTEQTAGKALIRSLYGMLCFAILFSFFGTVLGGLWADDSWGRFWGWDPKENGALIIVLWNALVLHARWGGIVKDRGLALLAVAGNIAVSWSWFGTNQLGVGLHAYGGFAGTVVLALGLFVLSQLIVIAAGLLPTSMWRSFRNEPGATV